MCSCGDLTKFYELSREMRKYLATYGPHFTKELCEDAVAMMEDRDGNRVKMIEKKAFNEMLERAGVKVEHDMLYDGVYVYSMAMADYWGSSINDETSLARLVKDYLDDPDGYEGIAFWRWYGDCCKTGVVVDWESYC